MHATDTARSEIAQMEGAIRRRHGCTSEYIETVTLAGESDSGLTGRSRVSVFRVDHPDAGLCYAWADDQTPRRRAQITTVLGRFAVRSPEDAIGEALLREHLDQRICAYYQRIGELAELSWSLG